MKAKTIMIVEDEELIRELLSSHFSQHNINVIFGDTGASLFQALDHGPELDAVILDLGLPDDDGLSVIRKLRSRSKIPLIILTSRDSAEDRISALELGADHYLEKQSINLRELSAHLNNTISRDSHWSSKGDADDIYENAGWAANSSAFTLKNPEGENVNISPSEFKVLMALLRNIGNVRSRDQLLDELTDTDDAPSDRMIDQYIARLRRKIEVNVKAPEIILTVSGEGYKINEYCV